MNGLEIVVPEQSDVARTDAEQGDSLVRLALDKGVSVEVLERTVALQERVADRHARGAYFEALAAFQSECKEIRQSKIVDYVTKSGAHVHYSYAPLPEITRAIRPLLAMHNLSYSFTAEQAGNTLNIVCVLRHIDGHEERSSFPVPIDSSASMSVAQKSGAALTYGRRQSLIAVLGLTTADQDTDAPDIGGEVEYITDAQAANLDDLIESVGVDRARFLKWLDVEKLADLEAGRLRHAITALEEKRKK